MVTMIFDDGDNDDDDNDGDDAVNDDDEEWDDQPKAKDTAAKMTITTTFVPKTSILPQDSKPGFLICLQN